MAGTNFKRENFVKPKCDFQIEKLEKFAIRIPFWYHLNFASFGGFFYWFDFQAIATCKSC